MLVLLVPITNAAGCRNKQVDEAKVPTYPVHGRLLVDGKPAVGAMIKFLPDKTGGRVPTALVREDGTFSASYYGSEDGAPAGEYKLLVAWMQVPPQGGLAQDRLQGRFLDASKPVRVITVAAAETNLEPIRLIAGASPVP